MARARTKTAKPKTANPKTAGTGRPRGLKASAKSAKASAKGAKASFVSKHPPKIRTPATLALIDRLRRICLALPGVAEQEAWGEPTWRIGGKIFAMCDTYHHGSPHLSVHLAAPPGAQAALIDAEPARFFRPPYTGGRGWIAVILDTEPSWDMVASLVATASDVIASVPRRVRR